MIYNQSKQLIFLNIKCNIKYNNVLNTVYSKVKLKNIESFPMLTKEYCFFLCKEFKNRMSSF